MKRIIFILTFVLFAVSGWSQTTVNHQYSSAPENSCFQIVQSELGVRFTFMIDKYSGSVFQLVEGDSGLLWQIMDKETQEYDTKNPNQVNYQFFTSGMGVRYTFLINVNTGITWQLTKKKNGDLFWEKMN